jgi:hypothetical protein
VKRGHSRLSETTGYVRRSPPPGQMAVVLVGLVIGVLLMGVQLWLLTVALDLYLGGQSTLSIWLLVAISGLVFLGGLVMLRVPGYRRRLGAETRDRE